MPSRAPRLIDRLAERRVTRFWAGAAEAAANTDLGSLKALRSRARKLRQVLDRVLTTVEERLVLPLIGSNAMNRPVGSDWQWRPPYWRELATPRGHAPAETRTELSGGMSLFHDCRTGEITIRQERNTRKSDLAPFGLVLEVLGFDGSFLSIAIDLPPEAMAGLSRRHLLRAEFDIEAERPLSVIARLNVKHGPNTEQVKGTVPMGAGEAVVEFDLGMAKINELRIEKAWLDVMFQAPAMNAVRLRDLTMSRRPRAEV